MRGRANSFFGNISIEPISGCWNWTGCTDTGGYGTMRINRRLELVHRVSAWCFLGFALRSSLHVLHHCDNRRCFNPKHLFIGTNLDNVRDRDRKGRHASRRQRLCLRGHSLSEPNLYIFNGRRICKECAKLRTKEWRERNGC